MNIGFDREDERLLASGGEAAEEELDQNENTNNDSDEYYSLPNAIKSRSLIWAVISFAAGILSFALCFFHYVGLALAATSLICALVSRKNLGFFEKYSIMGIILGITGFVCSVFSLVASMLGLFVF